MLTPVLPSQNDEEKEREEKALGEAVNDLVMNTLGANKDSEDVVCSKLGSKSPKIYQNLWGNGVGDWTKTFHTFLTFHDSLLVLTGCEGRLNLVCIL